MFVRIGVGLVAVAGFLAACGGEPRPSRDEIIASIQADPLTRDTPDEVAGCIADWYLRYAKPEDVTAFVNGQPDARTHEEIAPDEVAEGEMLDCPMRAPGKP